MFVLLLRVVFPTEEREFVVLLFRLELFTVASRLLVLLLLLVAVLLLTLALELADPSLDTSGRYTLTELLLTLVPREERLLVLSRL